MIQIRRTYDAPRRGDGRRILVERLWPRGMKKDAVAADVWMKEVAPNTELRKWFGHRVERWDEFRRRYRKELDANPSACAISFASPMLIMRKVFSSSFVSSAASGLLTGIMRSMNFP